jgi:hypothetical protein
LKSKENPNPNSNPNPNLNQSLDILNDSLLPFPSDLGDISYAKAICILFETGEKTDFDLKNELDRMSGVNIKPSGVESGQGFYTAIAVKDGGSDSTVYSLCDQKAKGVATTQAWTVIMNPDFSDKYYEEKDEVTILKRVTEEISKLFEHNQSCSSFSFSPENKVMIKKWKFSHPNTIYPSPYCEIAPGKG